MEHGHSVTQQSTSIVTSVTAYHSPKVEIRESPLEGLGIFAVSNIWKGEVVVVKAGHIITAQQAAQIEAELGDVALQIHDDIFLSPITMQERDSMSVFMNHSCDPNVGFDGQVTCVAMRDLKPGEELFTDYAMQRSDDYSLNCLCGTELCRGIVTGDDWRLGYLQRRYGNYFSSYILNKIRALSKNA